MTDTGYSGPADFWAEFDKEAETHTVPAPVAVASEPFRPDSRRKVLVMTAMNVAAVAMIGTALFATLQSAQ